MRVESVPQQTGIPSEEVERCQTVTRWQGRVFKDLFG
jgi:hypothetical protein